MRFSEGQTVVHPHHGPATVTRLLDRTVGGRTCRYLQLHVHGSDLRIAVPVEKVDEVGLRPVYAAAQVQALLRVLRAPSGDSEETWSRRFKANEDRLRAGDLLVTAAVVRDLTRRQHLHGLSSGERDMLKEARRPLLSELALALDLSGRDAEDLLDSAVLGTPPPPHLPAGATAVPGGGNR